MFRKSLWRRSKSRAWKTFCFLDFARIDFRNFFANFTDKWRGAHKILHFACERDFYVLRNHIFSTNFDLLNSFQNFRKHLFSTLFEPIRTNSSRKARSHTFSTLNGSKVYWTYDCELFEIQSDLESRKNLFHKQSVLFHEFPPKKYRL